jgi:putative transposase
MRKRVTGRHSCECRVEVGHAVPPVFLQNMNEYYRHLPHFHPHSAYVFLTWRLWHSLPARAACTETYPSPGHAFVATDRALDNSHFGSRWLEQAVIANLIAEAIQAGERERDFYELAAWVLMPNHVHLLILPKVPVPVITRWLKGSTARRANLLLGRTGQHFWQDESFDHWVRNNTEFDRIVRYIQENRVAAGLVSAAEL